VEPGALRERLADVLPAAMVPSQIVVMDELPRTPSGKVDRRALPAPDRVEAEYVAPRTALEAQVARIWGEALGVEQVGVDDNFFDLGGHSLLITRVAARIRHELGVEVPLRALFDGQTVAAVAALLERAPRAASPAELAVMSDLLDELEQM
jgi:acyl carrier protein